MIGVKLNFALNLLLSFLILASKNLAAKLKDLQGEDTVKCYRSLGRKILELRKNRFKCSQGQGEVLPNYPKGGGSTCPQCSPWLRPCLA